ncbi:Hpt domain-containing protein [Nitrosopumilus sp. K4]|uniref:Hpt domain-containing protein n=1 Tax=Nitrosopumilus sp. K4 TaxID=2795383 RepID=UPI001BAC3FB9|nr:Hpt domain-containing protein [Nitrosopumilus sp. K4]QUC65145.1 Hpt domain-containing protein [Nitrosopumilus sp. K4]
MSVSDDFVALATKEINEEINGIETILKSLSTDDDVFTNAKKLQRHTHKIKGLAPMMGKESVGEVASELDNILKKIIDGKKYELLKVLQNSVREIKSSMNDSSYSLLELKKKISELTLSDD